MPNAISLSADNRQPRHIAGINRGSPLTRGLVGAVHWGWQNFAVHNPAMRRRGEATPSLVPGTSSPVISMSNGLQGIGMTAAGTGQIIWAAENEVGLAAGSVYILCRYRDTTNRTAVLFGSMATGGVHTRRFGAHAPLNDGTTYWDFGGVTDDASRETWTGLGTKKVNSITRWAFVAAPRGMEIWNDGILRASHTSVTTRADSPDNNYYLFDGNANAATDLADIYLALVWNRGLSGGEVRQLDHNPWQVFATSDINRSFVPAAAIAPSTSGRIAGFGGFGAMGIG